MRAWVYHLTAVMALLSLADCATPAIPYDRTVAPPITRIGVLTTHWPATPSAILASDVGQSFGLVGGLVVLAMTEARDARLKTVVRSQHFVPSSRFDDDLRLLVAADGYHVVRMAIRRTGSGYLKKYATLKGADAWLDCVACNGDTSPLASATEPLPAQCCGEMSAGTGNR